MSQELEVPGSPATVRRVPTRRIEFPFETAEMPRHFMGGDLVRSHVVAVLSCMFPEGEDFFVRSVRNYRDRIVDPELKAQVAGFIGQESIHGREHRAFNDRLGELGYPTRFLDRRVKAGLWLLGRIQPTAQQLAVTAALEHYTATLAETLLTSEAARAYTDVAEVRELFMWHALEESEHKAVAFDVFQAVSGNESIRIGIMRATTVVFLIAVISGTAVSLALDPASRDLRRLWRSLRNLRHSPFFSRDVRTMLASYNQRGFHPDDRDTSALLERWRTEMFGPDGTMNGRLKVAV